MEWLANRSSLLVDPYHNTYSRHHQYPGYRPKKQAGVCSGWSVVIHWDRCGKLEFKHFHSIHGYHGSWGPSYPPQCPCP